MVSFGFTATRIRWSLIAVLKTGFSLIVGVAVGVFFHYLLWRLSLPGHPFIYANF